MNSSPKPLQSYLPRPAKDTLPPFCDTCYGTQVVYVLEDYLVLGRKMGEWEVQYPCPKCSGSVCSTCLNQGVVRYDVPRTSPYFGRLLSCPDCAKGREMALNIHRAALRDAGLPETYKSLTFKTWDDLPNAQRRGKELARAAAEIFADQGIVQLASVYEAAGMPFQWGDVTRRSLVFQGPVGTGKTGLAAAIMNRRIEMNQPCLYLRTLDALESIQARMDAEDRGLSPFEVLDSIKTSPCLILDEFNLKQYTAWRLDKIESIVRFRYNNALPTIFTLNDDPNRLEQAWGTQTASAVRGMAHWLEMTGEPLRYEGEAIRDVEVRRR